MKGPFQCRVGASSITKMSDLLLDLRCYLPREFLRKGRSLREVERWKATEFRQFLLYTGPVVLKTYLSNAMYEHFKLLFVSIFILSSVFFLQYL